jgi:hypothetical protein
LESQRTKVIEEVIQFFLNEVHGTIDIHNKWRRSPSVQVEIEEAELQVGDLAYLDLFADYKQD